MEALQKRCIKCEQQLPLSAFHKDATKKFGVGNRCKECSHKHKKEYWAANAQRLCKEASLRRLKNKAVYAENRRMKKYGLSKQALDRLLKTNQLCCAVCTKELTERTAKIDHNHNTGKVRGVLCNGCNSGLGLFKDSIEVLQKAIVYLENQRTTGHA